jgi:hypothetical protein
MVKNETFTCLHCKHFFCKKRLFGTKFICVKKSPAFKKGIPYPHTCSLYEFDEEWYEQNKNRDTRMRKAPLLFK